MIFNKLKELMLFFLRMALSFLIGMIKAYFINNEFVWGKPIEFVNHIPQLKHNTQNKAFHQQ
jgi:hypothetical protein